MFSGYNDSSIILFPPKKIQRSNYRCDSKFDLDELLEMYTEDSINYGIVLLSGKEYRCYIVEITGSHIEFNLTDCDEVTLQKRQKKGGQSAVRFDRIREEKRLIYIKEMMDAIRSSYMRNNDTECIIKGLIVAGVGDIKKEVMDQDLFKQFFSKKVMRILNTSVIEDHTVHEVYEKCIDIISNFDMKLVNSTISKLRDLIASASDLLVFGETDILAHLEDYKINKLIISDIKSETLKMQLEKYMNNCNFEIVIVPDKILETYGSIVGIKYY